VSIVMPCLNEAESLAFCIENARRALDEIARVHGLGGEILIADNGSTDGSQALAESLGARVVAVSDRGYGAALMGGFAAARGRYLVMGDADGSYDFCDAVPMVARLEAGADLCMGTRFQGGIRPGAMPWKNRYIGNPALTGILNLFFRTGVDDAHCGLRAVRRDAYRALRVEGTGMEFASEMVIKASLAGLRIDQVPVTLSPDRRGRAPHLRPWRDGWRHLRYLLMLSPTWVFAVPATAMTLVGLVVLALATAKALGLVAITTFGESWAVLGAMLVSTGHLALILALATHLHGVRMGFRRAWPWLFRARGVLTVEGFFVISAVLAGTGILGLFAAAGYWSANAFRPLGTVLPVVIPGLLASIGLQQGFSAFLLAVVSGNRADFLAGLAADTPTDATATHPALLPAGQLAGAG
jgi:hypothetical protein